MFKPSTFAADCEKAGFTPYEAMCFYDEVRRFAFPTLKGGNSKIVETKAWDEFRAFAINGLVGVKSPSDFREYRKSWQKFDLIGLSKEEKSFEFLTKKVSRKELLGRCSGSFHTQPPVEREEQWNAWEKIALTWDDIGVALEQDIPRLSRRSVPKGITLEKAKVHLQEVVSQCELGYFSWPYALVESAENLWVMAEDLRQCAQEIGSQTGWGNNALGINGRIALGFGVDYEGLQGRFIPMDEGCGEIITSGFSGWGPVGHEWLHAVDSAIHYTPIKGVSKDILRKTKESWKQVLNAVGSAAWKEEDRGKVESVMKDVVLSRWAENQKVSEYVKKALDSKDFNETLFFEEFKILYKDNVDNIQEPYLSLHGAQALADVHMARVRLEKPASLWTTFAGRFKAAVESQFPEKWRDDWKDYFFDEKERAAHSFEATFAKGSLVSDVLLDRSFRYPTSFEAKEHGKQWKLFFKTALDWKQEVDPELAATNELQMSLKERRRTRGSAPSEKPVALARPRA